MGSEQSSQPQKKQPQRAPIRRGHTIAISSAPEAGRSTDPPPSGRSSPGASICSDSELPYISYTVDRPIGGNLHHLRIYRACAGSICLQVISESVPSGYARSNVDRNIRLTSDSPKTSSKTPQSTNKKSLLQRRQLSLQARKTKRTRDIIVVKQATDNQLDEDIRRVQDIPTFLPIMRGTLGLPGARDPEVLEGLDYRPWVRLTTRLQAHLAACAHPLAAEEINLATKIREMDSEVTRLYNQMVDRQRSNARHAERLARVHEMSHQLTRCHYILNQTLQDVEELNQMLPEEKRLQPFVWKIE